MVERFFDNIGEEMSVFLKKYDNNMIYNEISFQHEFGIYLRNKFEKLGYKVEFERNVSFFGINYNNKDINYDELKEYYSNEQMLLSELKHEIDIVVYNEDKTRVYGIELKYPSIKSYYDEEKMIEIKKANGAYPRVMYECIKDIKFMEVLKKRGFTKTFTIVLVNIKDAFGNKNYFELTDGIESEKEIYDYFRNKDGNIKSIHGMVRKSTGKDMNEKCVFIEGNYIINWKDWKNSEEVIGKYYLITTGIEDERTL